MKLNEDKIPAQLKLACALNKLLLINKKKHLKNKKEGINDLSLDHSYDKISSRTGLRLATISDVFSGKSDVKISTIELLLESMGFSYAKLGSVMDKISNEEVTEYINGKKGKG